MIKRALSIFLCVLMMFSVLSAFPFTASAQTYSEELLAKGFDSSYVEGLSKLHEKYPNWNFEPIFTGVSWEQAVAGERNPHSKQLIQKQSALSSSYYCNCSSCYKNGNYVIREGSNWISASQTAVEYYMDPRNWFDEKHIFQFLPISYDGSQTQSGVESILSSTWMKNSDITYKNTTGADVTYINSSGNTVRYSSAVIDAAQNSGISAYYLASKIVQEVGGSSPTAGGACGTKAPFIGIYNYYNIGANSGAMEGLEWASGFLKAKSDTVLYSEYDYVTDKGMGNTTAVKSGQYMSYIYTCGSYYRVRLYTVSGGTYKTGAEGYIPVSALRTTYFNYGRPWTDPYRAIYNGAIYIANSFSKYQNTGYLQKFNLNPASGNMYNHEYMANVQAAASEAETTYKAYNEAGILASAKTFYIPVFTSMSAQPEKLQTNIVTGLKLSVRNKESLTFKWNKLNNATKYYMYVKNVTNGNKFSKTVKTNSAKISGLNPGNEYSVKVKAYVNGSWTGYTQYVTAHTKPTKVKNLKVKKRTGSSVTLSWSKISGVSGYYIYSYSPSAKKYTKVKTVTGSKKNSATITGLTSGKKYEYAVCAFVKDSATKSGVKSSIVKTAAKPKKVKLKKAVFSSKSKIKTSWHSLEGSATGFQIQYAKDKKFKKKIATKTFAGKTKKSYTGKGFSKGKKYYVRVRAYTSVGKNRVYGSWSNTVRVK